MADERDRLRARLGLPPLNQATSSTPASTPVVDERTQAAAKATAASAVASSGINDPYYVRDPRTGLSPAQAEAQAVLKQTQESIKSLGIPSIITTTPGSAGRLSTPPTTGLQTGYEWYAFNKPGGGFEWRQRPTRETLTAAYGGGAGGLSEILKGLLGGGGGGGGGGDAISALLAKLEADSKAAALASQQAEKLRQEELRSQRQSAFDLLFTQFSEYGLGALVEPLRSLIEEGVSPAEFTLRLRASDAYKKRFAANQARINRGLRALSEAEYIGLEDQYQTIMRNYGLPESYYTRGEMGRQEGFERFIGGDVSAAELEDRIQTAQNRVINAAPEVSQALRQFYPGISNGDILAYALDPDKAITEIRRKVTAAEIGAGAMQSGLATGVTRAEELARFGVTGEQARAGFQAISDILPRGRQLSEIYGRQGVSPYTQTTAEQEVFGLTGAAEAGRQRRKLTELEQASFSGQAGVAGGALARDRAGAF